MRPDATLLTDSAIDFLASMLAWDPQSRPDPESLARHPWLAGDTGRPFGAVVDSSMLSPDVLGALTAPPPAPVPGLDQAATPRVQVGFRAIQEYNEYVTSNNITGKCREVYGFQCTERTEHFGNQHTQYVAARLEFEVAQMLYTEVGKSEAGEIQRRLDSVIETCVGELGGHNPAQTGGSSPVQLAFHALLLASLKTSIFNLVTRKACDDEGTLNKLRDTLTLMCGKEEAGTILGGDINGIGSATATGGSSADGFALGRRGGRYRREFLKSKYRVIEFVETHDCTAGKERNAPRQGGIDSIENVLKEMRDLLKQLEQNPGSFAVGTQDENESLIRKDILSMTNTLWRFKVKRKICDREESSKEETKVAQQTASEDVRFFEEAKAMFKSIYDKRKVLHADEKHRNVVQAACKYACHLASREDVCGLPIDWELFAEAMSYFCAAEALQLERTQNEKDGYLEYKIRKPMKEFETNALEALGPAEKTEWRVYAENYQLPAVAPDGAGTQKAEECEEGAHAAPAAPSAPPAPAAVAPSSNRTNSARNPPSKRSASDAFPGGSN